MKDHKKLIIIGLAFLLAFIVFDSKNKRRQNTLPVQPQQVLPPQQPQQPPPPPPEPEIPDISNPVPSYQDYSDIITQIKEWQQEAPDLVYEVGVYGKTTRGNSLWFMRMGNKYRESKLKVLLFAAIHGNESIGTSTMMAFCGTLLSKYGKDNKVTELLNTREIVLVPVVSPDTYPHTRWVDGVDPNRNFPSKRSLQVNSVPPVRALMELHKKENFKAVLCGHSSGRWWLYPWSEIKEETPNHNKYNDLLDRMTASGARGYKKKQSAYFYPGQTIVGGACDWFYRNGCVAMTPEFGTHQRKSSDEEIRTELGLVYDAFVIYITEAPTWDVPQIDPEYHNAVHLKPYTPYDPIRE